jgi:hypothetical protein
MLTTLSAILSSRNFVLYFLLNYTIHFELIFVKDIKHRTRIEKTILFPLNYFSIILSSVDYWITSGLCIHLC